MNKYRRKNQSIKAFSIIEVMLAGALLAIITFGIVSAWLYGENALIKSGDHGRGVAIASEGLEIVRNLRDTKFGSLQEGTYSLNNNGTNWTLVPNEKEVIGAYNRIISVIQKSTNEFEVKVTVAWKSVDGSPSEYTASTILTNWQQEKGKSKRRGSVLEISEVDASPTLNGATITWTTNKLASSKVDYGTTNSYGTSPAISDTAPGVLNHIVELTSLSPDTTYHYRVKSIDATGFEATSGDYSFTTALDTTPPEISDIVVTSITSTSATIEWETDEVTSSVIDYKDTDPPMPGGTTTPEFDTNPRAVHHTKQLTLLSADTTYYFLIHATDGSNNETISDVQTFCTCDMAPIISNVQVTAQRATYLTISWITAGVPSDAQINESSPDKVSSPVVDDDYILTSHEVTISGLTPCTEHSITLISRNQLLAEGEHNMTYSTSGCPPTIVNGDQGGFLFGGSRKTLAWPYTDGDTSSYIFYLPQDHSPFNFSDSTIIGRNYIEENLDLDQDNMSFGPALFQAANIAVPFGNNRITPVDIAISRDYLFFLTTVKLNNEVFSSVSVISNPTSPGNYSLASLTEVCQGEEANSLYYKEYEENNTTVQRLFVGCNSRIKIFDVSGGDLQYTDVVRPNGIDLGPLTSIGQMLVTSNTSRGNRYIIGIANSIPLQAQYLFYRNLSNIFDEDSIQYPLRVGQDYFPQLTEDSQNRLIMSGFANNELLLSCTTEAFVFGTCGDSINTVYARALSSTTSVENYMFANTGLKNKELTILREEPNSDIHTEEVDSLGLCAQFTSCPSNSGVYDDGDATSIVFLKAVGLVFMSKNLDWVLIDPGTGF